MQFTGCNQPVQLYTVLQFLCLVYKIIKFCAIKASNVTICIICFKSKVKNADSYRPWTIGEKYFISWHPSEKHLVYGLFEGLIGTLLPRKRLICYYLVLNCITVYAAKKT